MSLELIRVYHNGFYVVAEFIKRGHMPDRKLVLNAKYLEVRIKNGKKYNLDTSVEQMALELVRGHKDYRPDAA